MPESLRGQGAGRRLLWTSRRRLVSGTPSQGRAGGSAWRSCSSNFLQKRIHKPTSWSHPPARSQASRPVGTSRPVTQDTHTGGMWRNGLRSTADRRETRIPALVPPGEPCKKGSCVLSLITGDWDCLKPGISLQATYRATVLRLSGLLS